MRNVAVVGAGVFPFGRHDDLLYMQMGRPAVLEAIKDAGIDKKQIDACYCGTTGGVGVGHEICSETGIIGIPITRVENACVSGSNAFRQAWMDIALGIHDIMLWASVPWAYCGCFVGRQERLNAKGPGPVRPSGRRTIFSRLGNIADLRRS